MKKLLIALGVSAAVVSGSAMAAPTDVPGGPVGTTANVKVLGTVTADTCKIELPDELTYTIQLDDISQNELNKVEYAKAKFTNIALTNCPATFTFQNKNFNKIQLVALDSVHTSGSSDPASGLLKNRAETNAAQNVYVRLLKDETTPFKLGRSDDAGVIEDLALNKENITFKIGAEYYRKAGEIATPGQVTADAQLRIVYK